MIRVNRMKQLIGGVIVGLLATSAAWATPYVSQGPFVVPQPGSGIPAPTQVPGKEYTNLPDRDAAGALTPGQGLFWDGVGGVANSLNYCPGVSCEVDALANNHDALFHEVIANQAALLVSVETDPGNIAVWAEPIGGGFVVWATQPQVNNMLINDLDALEVWGPELVVDADRFSLLGEPGGAAVIRLDGSVMVTQVQICTAIGAPSNCDLDALMTFDEPGSLQDQILFSIRPIDRFDGGEIWHWNLDPNTAPSFLFHGGHLWNTDFDVTAWLGHENVDALEAVATIPEPGTWLLLATGLVGLLGYGWRRKQLAA